MLQCKQKYKVRLANTGSFFMCQSLAHSLCVNLVGPMVMFLENVLLVFPA